jgi:hypothetical protein
VSGVVRVPHLLPCHVWPLHLPGSTVSATQDIPPQCKHRVDLLLLPKPWRLDQHQPTCDLCLHTPWEWGQLLNPSLVSIMVCKTNLSDLKFRLGQPQGPTLASCRQVIRSWGLSRLWGLLLCW